MEKLRSCQDNCNILDTTGYKNLDDSKQGQKTGNRSWDMPTAIWKKRLQTKLPCTRSLHNIKKSPCCKRQRGNKHLLLQIQNLQAMKEIRKN